MSAARPTRRPRGGSPDLEVGDSDGLAANPGTGVGDGEDDAVPSVLGSKSTAIYADLRVGEENEGMRRKVRSGSTPGRETTGPVREEGGNARLLDLPTNTDCGTGGAAPSISVLDGLVKAVDSSTNADGDDLRISASAGPGSTGIAVASLGTRDTRGQSPAAAPSGATTGATAGKAASSPTAPA